MDVYKIKNRPKFDNGTFLVINDKKKIQNYSTLKNDCDRFAMSFNMYDGLAECYEIILGDTFSIYCKIINEAWKNNLSMTKRLVFVDDNGCGWIEYNNQTDYKIKIEAYALADNNHVHVIVTETAHRKLTEQEILYKFGYRVQTV